MAKVKFSEIQVGDYLIIEAKNNTAAQVIVENKDSDIKNGISGIDYKTDSGEFGWCYTDQILSIVKKEVLEKIKKAPIVNKKITFDNIEEGDEVVVSSGREMVKGIVTEKEENIKNGTSGIGYTSDKGDSRLCYTDQICQLKGPDKIKKNKKPKP